MNGLCWIKYIAKRMKDQLQLSFFWQGLSFPRGSIFHGINWLCIPSKTLWYLSTHTVYDSCHSNTNFTIYWINFPLDSQVFPLFRDCHVTIFGCYHIVNNLNILDFGYHIKNTVNILYLECMIIGGLWIFCL